jgi:hypothetical protein
MECGNFIPAVRWSGKAYTDCTMDSRRNFPFVITAFGRHATLSDLCGSKSSHRGVGFQPARFAPPDSIRHVAGRAARLSHNLLLLPFLLLLPYSCPTSALTPALENLKNSRNVPLLPFLRKKCPFRLRPTSGPRCARK